MSQINWPKDKNRDRGFLITSPPHTRDFSRELGGFIFESYLRMV